MTLEDWLYGSVIFKFNERILPIDKNVSLIWGQMIGEKKAQGITLPASDAWIAATAIHHNLIVVTQNTKDFAETGAILFDPWQAQ